MDGNGVWREICGRNDEGMMKGWSLGDFGCERMVGCEKAAFLVKFRVYGPLDLKTKRCIYMGAKIGQNSF